VTKRSYETARAEYDPARINAIVLLTDGKNEDGDPSDDNRQLQNLLTTLRRGSEGENARPIRIFPIAYGRDADLDTLRTIAEATNSAVYDASDPTTINKVFTAVVSNF
jgi:Ca-activated chloride channel family protein